MKDILLTLGGTFLGILISIFYEKFQEKQNTATVKKLLKSEIEHNIKGLLEVLDVMKDLSGGNIPSCIKPLSIEELSTRIENCCKRDALNAFYKDLPKLDKTLIDETFSFYDGFRKVPNTFREIERFAGNIRPGLFEDYIQDLILKGHKILPVLK